MHPIIVSLLTLAPTLSPSWALGLDLTASTFQDPTAVAPMDSQREVISPSKEALVEIAFELTEIMRLDQIHRTPVSWGTTDPEELARLKALDDEAHLAEWARRNRMKIRLPEAQEKELMRQQAVLDAANFVRLMTLIDSYGYPDPERLGIEAPDPLPVLIHATPENYDSAAPRLLEEARAVRLGARAYAALYDRKRQHRGMMQLYGTCHQMDRATGEVLPPEILDLEVTNRARAEIGLDPLAEYTIATPSKSPNR